MVALAFVAFPALMVGVFTSDPAVVRDGTLYLRALALAQVTMGFEIVLEASMGGAGYTIVPMLWAGLFTAARIPLAAWLAGPLGLAGIYWAIGVTAVCRGVAMVLLWRRGRWEGVAL